jgi:hypothetical protein
VYKIAIIFHYFYHHFSLFYHYLNKSWSDDATGNERPPSAAASSLLGPCPGRKVAQTVTALPPQASHAAFRVRAFQCRRSVCRQATVPRPSRCPSESPSVTVTQPQRRPHTGSADRSRLAPRRLGRANLKPAPLGPLPRHPLRVPLRVAEQGPGPPGRGRPLRGRRGCGPAHRALRPPPPSGMIPVHSCRGSGVPARGGRVRGAAALRPVAQPSTDGKEGTAGHSSKRGFYRRPSPRPPMAPPRTPLAASRARREPRRGGRGGALRRARGSQPLQCAPQ